MFRSALRVLVVDDFAPLADHLAGLLRRNGHSVQVAYDGLEALRVAERFQPHALISDVHMPGLNGFELAQAFAERFPKCRTVLVTIDPRAAGESYDHREYRVLQKPVPLEELFEFLAACDPKD
jgi:CheY-like chemotaxis protein